MTPEGLMKLKKELNHYVNNLRPEVIQEIAKARSYGDLSENAEYHAAKEKQHRIEKKIRELEEKINRAQVIDISSLQGPKIYFGATVVLFDENEETEVRYQIVGADEADLKMNKISIESLLARELIGKEEGTTFDFLTPRGEKTFTILSVKYIITN
jgi:transcription elongation factor GreA